MPAPRPVVLVTGAARRIGRVIALHFARSGWDVAVHYATSREDAIKTVGEIEASGAKATAINRDLSVQAGVETLVPEVVERLGRIDCVVNNAALFEYDAAASFSYATLEAHMRANLAAPIVLARSLRKHLAESSQAGDQCSVVNLLDQKLYNYNPDFLSYTLSKAALQAATTMLAQALAPRVRVVGVAPGITMPSGEQSVEDFQKARRVTPLGRSSSPEDVARTVLFAAESPALTGTTLLVDGGQHLIPLDRDIMFLMQK